MSDTDTVAEASAEATRLVGTGWDENGNDTAQSVLTGTNLKVRALALTAPDLVVPILFVPGIMGTRLKIKNRDKVAAWFPPEGVVDAVVLLAKHLFRSAADRQRVLDPNNTEVDDNGAAHPDESSKALLAIAEGKTDAERAKWRGWGQVYAKSYSGILSLLEKSFGLIFDPATQGKQLMATWSALVAQQDAAKFGAQKPFVPLKEEQLRDAADVLYPVHGVGYNWLQSNKASGERLAKEIERITAHYRSKGKICEKVVIVTHSMGGLVARSCAQEPGMADRILGIVHGVMPAIGAPATYKRFRAGWESAEQVILGRNAAECTSVMANAPGPLELLPTAEYKTKSDKGERHWLRASYAGMDSQGQPQEQDVFLGDGDPYADIYLNNSEDWWKLVKEDFIDPAGREDREKVRRDGKKIVTDNPDASDFQKFQFNMDSAAKLHRLINGKYHPNTYAYYAADPKQLAWNEVQWRSKQLFDGDLKVAVLDDDNLNGTVGLAVEDEDHRASHSLANPEMSKNSENEESNVSLAPSSVIAPISITKKSAKRRKYTFEIQTGKGPGDGTVPEESGSAPTPYVVQIFRHEGKSKGHESYDHQGSYNAKLAQISTLYSIAKMVSESDWLKRKICEN